MSFKLNIKNLGRLSDAEVRVGRFTVLAGPNNTGKSTVSKLLYSVFDGVNANHASKYLNEIFEPLREPLDSLPIRAVKKKKEVSFLIDLEEKLDEIGNLLEAATDMSNEDIDGLLQKIRSILAEFQKVFEKNRNRLIDFLDENDGVDIFWKKSHIKETINDLANTLESIKDQIENLDGISVALNGMGKKIVDNFRHNFQVRYFSQLRSKEDRDITISIDGIGTITLAEENLIKTSISEVGISLLQKYSRVIYLESPIYWKLKDALENLRLSPRFRFPVGRKALNGVPGYFYDLASALREEYSGEIGFSEQFEKLVSEDVLAGKIAIAENGELKYQQGGRDFSLHLTAMGVVNIGILALLIEKNILDEGAFLFIDEPEAHLHPAWEVQFASVLFDLARQGVNVVVATHSINVLKWLEVHVKHNPEDRYLIALNKFTSDGVESSGDFEELLSSIKEELSDPFSKLYIQGI